MEQSPQTLYLETLVTTLNHHQEELKHTLKHTQQELFRIKAKHTKLQHTHATQVLKEATLIQQLNHFRSQARSLAGLLKNSRLTQSQRNRYTSVKDSPTRRKLYAYLESFMDDQNITPLTLTPVPRLYQVFLSTAYVKAIGEPPTQTVFIKQLMEMGYAKKRMRDPYQTNKFCWGVIAPICTPEVGEE